RDNGLMRLFYRTGALPSPRDDVEYQIMIDVARRQRVPIYIVTIANNGNEVAELMRVSPVSAGEYVEAVGRRLELLSEVTGGRVIFPRSLEEVIPLYNQISRELGSAYSMGYVSSIPPTFQGFREIKVTTHDPRLRVVQSRPGYVAP